ncbi:MAG: molybdopterin synthase catalytic subunit MoaE [Parvibaculaceae bacterium]
MIRVQEQPFDASAELKAFQAASASGACVLFIGTVRDRSDGKRVDAMTLELYPGMTEKALADIETEARGRWPLDDVLVIHRHGRLLAGEDIVLVLARSAHREAAFEAARFLMDWLKTKAPFWKLEAGPDGERWVEARDSDEEAAGRWKR